MMSNFICRICLMETVSYNVISLYDKHAESEKCMWNMLFEIIGIDEYNMEHMIPYKSKICRPCSVRLIESYEFQKLCQIGWDQLISMTNEFVNNDDFDLTNTSEHICNDCNKSFKFECNLKIHIKVHHAHTNGFHQLDDQTPVKLELETNAFVAQQIEVWIEEEKDNIDDGKPSKNSDCFETNPIEVLLDAGNSKTRIETKLIKEEKQSKRKSNLRRRKARTVEEPKYFDCPDCTEVCSSSKMLKLHIQSAHNSIDRTAKKKREKRNEPRLCPICGKSFNAKNENGFQKHMFHHDPSIGKIKYYQCELCDRKFLGKRSLEEHMNFHLNIRPYTCEVETCKKSFIYEQSFKNHKKLHLGKDFECDICRKQFITSTNLKYHLTRVHQGVKKNACDQCDKSYFTLQHLKVHQLSHLEKKAYTCDVCNRGITHYASLLSHMLLHTGKPFQCDHCNMAFTHRWRFGKHLAERHSIFEIPKKYARKMAEKLVNNDKEQVVQDNTLLINK